MAWSAVLCVSGATGGSDDVAASSRPALRGSGRRFVVLGGTAREALDLSAWSEAAARRIERLLGAPQPRAPWREFRLDIHAPATSSVARVTAAAGWEAGRFVQRLAVHGYADADPCQIETAFCTLFLAGYVVDAMPRPESAAGTVGPLPRPVPAVPPWLVQGIVQNLSAAARAASAEAVYESWRDGAMPSLESLLGLRGEGRAAGPGDPAPGACAGMLVAWLRSLPQSADGFRRLFGVLAAGGDAGVGFWVGVVPGCRSPADVEAAWDAWILRQRRVIHVPGETTRLAVEGFKAQLLLYPADSGIGSEREFRGPLRLADLLGHRRSSWLGDVVGSRIAALRLASAGRGPALARVAELYVAYLSGLAGREGAETLRDRLRAADAALAELEMDLGADRNAARE
jgi:hypothetical protein